MSPGRPAPAAHLSNDVDFTPQQGSFLWAVAQAAPNDQVRVANVRGTAGAVARDVRQMLDEIEDLRLQRDRLLAIALAYAELAPQMVADHAGGAR